MIVADAIKKPWIFHSDGNLFPILDGLLKLGMNAIHPMQPSAMDINKMKARVRRPGVHRSATSTSITR